MVPETGDKMSDKANTILSSYSAVETSIGNQVIIEMNVRYQVLPWEVDGMEAHGGTVIFSD